MITAPEQHRIWLVNLRREGFKPTKFSKICSAHFEDSFIDRSGQIVHLRAGAIPKKNYFPAYLLPKTGTKRKLSLKRTTPVSIAYVGIPVPECGPSILIYPSPGVHKICIETEKSFQRMLKTTSGNLPHGPGLPSAISTVVLQVCTEASVFE